MRDGYCEPDGDRQAGLRKVRRVARPPSPGRTPWGRGHVAPMCCSNATRRTCAPQSPRKRWRHRVLSTRLGLPLKWAASRNPQAPATLRVVPLSSRRALWRCRGPRQPASELPPAPGNGRKSPHDAPHAMSGPGAARSQGQRVVRSAARQPHVHGRARLDIGKISRVDADLKLVSQRGA